MLNDLTILLRGAPADLLRWIENPSARDLRLCLVTITIGCAAYGLTVGLWRAPEMGFYVALKMPALIFLTLAGNGFLNGILGIILGSGLGFRQSLAAQLLSFTIAALILGSLAPVTFFMALNAPTPDAENAATAHANFLLAHTSLIAIAGILANLHLARLLILVCPTPQAATATLAAWIAGNAFLGAQLSWIMRPFFGTPTIKVQFLRDHPFDGTFYETVWRALQRISHGNGLLLVLIGLLTIIVLHYPVLKILQQNNQKTKP